MEMGRNLLPAVKFRLFEVQTQVEKRNQASQIVIKSNQRKENFSTSMSSYVEKCQLENQFVYLRKVN